MNYNIYAAVFADELQTGERIKPEHDAEPVTVVDVFRLASGQVLISHDRGACVRGGRELVRLEVER